MSHLADPVTSARGGHRDDAAESQATSPATPQTPNLLSTSVWIALTVLTIVLIARNVGTHQLGALWDDASYVVLARSLSEAAQYGHMSYPGTPLPTRYPFGFPLVLAAVSDGARSLPAMLGVSMAATLVNVALIFWAWPLLCRGYSRWWAIGAAAASTLSPLVITQTDMVMSEPLFTTCTLLALIATERCARAPRSTTAHVALGVAVAATIAVRTIGVAVVAGLVVSLLWRLRHEAVRVLTTAALAGLTALGAIVISTNVGVRDIWPSTYLQHSNLPTIGEHSLPWGTPGLPTEPMSPLARLRDGVCVYATQHVRAAVVPVGGGGREVDLGRRIGIPALPTVIGLGVSGLVLLGAAAAAARGTGLMPVVVVYEVCSLLVLFNWPWHGPRFLYPLQMFLVFQFMTGLAFVVRSAVRVTPLTRVVAAGAVAAATVAAVTMGLAAAGAAKSFSPPDTRRNIRNLEVGALWLREHSPANAVFMARNPDSVYVHAERQVLDYPLEFEQGPFLNYLTDRHVAYVLVAPELWWRDDGQLAYDEVMATKYLPLIESLEAKTLLVSVFRSEPDKVEVFRVNVDTTERR